MRATQAAPCAHAPSALPRPLRLRLVQTCIGHCTCGGENANKRNHAPCKQVCCAALLSCIYHQLSPGKQVGPWPMGRPERNGHLAGTLHRRRGHSKIACLCILLLIKICEPLSYLPQLARTTRPVSSGKTPTPNNTRARVHQPSLIHPSHPCTRTPAEVHEGDEIDTAPARIYA